MRLWRFLSPVFLSFFIIPLSACESPRCIVERLSMKNEITLNIVLYSYLDRPIFDTFLNGEYAGGRAEFPFGVKGTISGARISLGAQSLTWRLGGPKGMPRNGETVVARNPLTLTADQIPTGARYLGVHIYPDETAELIASRNFPELSSRGKEPEEEHSRNDN